MHRVQTLDDHTHTVVPAMTFGPGGLLVANSSRTSAIASSHEHPVGHATNGAPQSAAPLQLESRDDEPHPFVSFDQVEIT